MPVPRLIVSPDLKGMQYYTRLCQAARTIGHITMKEGPVGRRVLLGLNEAFIRPETLVIESCHVPNAGHASSDTYRDAIIGFFAGVQGIKDGQKWLDGMLLKAPGDEIIAQALVDRFRCSQYPEYDQTDWMNGNSYLPALGQLSADTLKSIGWVLRSGYFGVPNEVMSRINESDFHFLNIGRVKAAPDLAADLVKRGTEHINIWSLGTVNGACIRVGGFVDAFKLKREGAAGRIYKPHAGSDTVTGIAFESGKFVVNMRRVGPQPIESSLPFGQKNLKYVELTMAKDPELLTGNIQR